MVSVCYGIDRWFCVFVVCTLECFFYELNVIGSVLADAEPGRLEFRPQKGMVWYAIVRHCDGKDNGMVWYGYGTGSFYLHGAL